MTPESIPLADEATVHSLLDELEETMAGQMDARAAAARQPGLLAWLRGVTVLAAALLLFVALSVATPLFLQIDNLLLVARQISILAIIATGMTFLFISREIDLSVGSIYGFLVIGMAYLIGRFNVEPWAAMAIAVLAGAGLGWINGFLTTRFGLPSFIVTLGALSILRGAALLLSGGWPITISNVPEGHSFPFFTAGHLGGIVPMQIFWMTGIMLVAGFVLSKTRFGAHVYATGGSEESARLAGIATRRIKTICFAITGALCGVAGGLLLGQVGSGSPLTGSGFELDIIAAVVIGGTPLFGGAGSILGTLLGAAIMGMITNGLVLLGASAHFEPVAKGAIIVLAVLFDLLVRRRKV
jgi:ribose transport system permease protein